MKPKEATFHIHRYDPPQKKSWIAEYHVPVTRGMTVLEGLWYIVDFIDGSLSFRYSCRGAVCGSCAMVINETITLACRTQIASLKSEKIEIAPLPRMRIIKDLVVDMDLFLEKYRLIKPYVIHREAHEGEVLQSPESRNRIFSSVKCILCASCHGACPLTAVDEDYLGPAVLNAAQRFAFDERNDLRDDVLKSVNHIEGALGCRTISRCTEVCPKYIGPSIRIKELKQKIKEYSEGGKFKPGKEGKIP